MNDIFHGNAVFSEIETTTLSSFEQVRKLWERSDRKNVNNGVMSARSNKSLTTEPVVVYIVSNHYLRPFLKLHVFTRALQNFLHP